MVIRLLVISLLLAQTVHGQPSGVSGTGLEPPDDTIKMEYFLGVAPRERILDILKEEYDGVKFTLHPSRNSFYAEGSREELLQLKRELSD